MSIPTVEERKENRLNLRRKLVFVAIGLMISIMAMAVATFAWYIYNTQAHTTKVKMAAGTSTKLEIAKEYDGEYSSAVDLQSFQGGLEPVSTDKITNGFQIVTGYKQESKEIESRIANKFGPADAKTYFKTTLYIRTNAKHEDIYIAGLDYDQSDRAKLLATAVRVGFVVYEPGDNTNVESEYIFELSQERNPKGRYNTEKGMDGHVLDSTKTDGSTVDFRDKLKNSNNFVNYDPTTGAVTKKAGSLALFDLLGGKNAEPGTPVRVDVYLWLEGCDADCTGELGSLVLKNFAVTFASIDRD